MKNRRSRRVCHLLVLVLVFTLLIACVSEQSLNEATEEPVTPAVRHPTISPTATARPTATPLHVSPTPEPTVTLTPVPRATPEPISGDFTSEGVNVAGALLWHEAGYKGQGVKVGIIETGFEGFSGLIGQELPTPAGIRCYTRRDVFSGDLKDCENGDVHGTATAETIIDTAPGVLLYIARPRSGGDLRDKVDWMAEEGVSVAALYGFGHFEGPGDGTSPDPLSALGSMDYGVNRGITFVVPAGNSGRDAWFKRAPFSDVDGDTFIDFAGTDDGNALEMEKGERAYVQLRWEDAWPGASRDLDLHIRDTATQQIIAHSRDKQSGSPGDVPYESISFNAARDGVYEVAISQQGGSVPDWIHLWSWNRSIEHYTAGGGIHNTGESANPGVLAVGAANWDDTQTVTWYSSRGPTPDGRVKPDIVARLVASRQPSTRVVTAAPADPHPTWRAWRPW